jgi:DNA-binding NarL/FixJ family response regulator
VRVLVVEDDYLVATQVESALSEAGFDVVGIAITADEAVRLAAAERPLFVIMDVRLRGQRDGIEAAIQLFQENGIRSLFATAHYDSRSRARAEAASPLGWLPKPYTMEAIVGWASRAASELSRAN